MSIQQAEQLKQQWTDQQVVVLPGIPELRRFQGLVGRVRTVNMNCRLLVEFDGPADISWYDIDPQFLKLAEPQTARDPQHHTKADAHSEKTSTPTKTAPPAGSGSSGSGLSPIDQIRQQKAPVAAATESRTAASPLDKIRQQAAAGAKTATTSVSPLEQIRRQAGGTAASTGSSAPREADEPPNSSSPDAPLSPLEQIRRQQPGVATPPGPAKSDRPDVTSESPEAADVAFDPVKRSAPPEPDFVRQPDAPVPDPSESDSIQTQPMPATETTTSATATSVRIELPLDQIRRQAGASTGVAGIPTIIEQIHAQALSGVVSGSAESHVEVTD